MSFNNDLTSCNDNVDFEDEELGITNAELEEKLSKGIELLKEMAHLKGAPTAEYDVELRRCCRV